MSTTTRFMTAEEFYEFIELPQNVDRMFELDEGEVIELSPPGTLHGLTCLAIGSILWKYCQKRGAGLPCSNDSAFIVSRNPDTIRGPDLSLYLRGEEETFKEVVAQADREASVPTLAVEVLSPSDRPAAVMRKVKQYQSAGVELVWVVDPLAEDVMIHRLDDEPQFLDSDETLVGGSLLPDFSCRVADFFRMPSES